jgi:ABC-type phosphate/phosphonate transport system substrate-binding protein
MAISVETLIGANITDARAAYRVWINQAFRQNGQADVEFDPEIFVPSEQVLREIRLGTIDCYGVNALEFVKVADLTSPDNLLLLSYLADGIDYVLLVHKNSSFKKIEDLRGVQIATHLNHDMVLLPAWLDTMLASKNQPEASRFFSSLTPCEKLNQVVLPVFFRRLDGACLTRRNWETVVELNPQLGRDLWPIAVSPRVIPCAIGIRRSCNPAAVKQFIDLLLRVSTQPEGQQILALYQANGFVVRPTSAINSTLEMVRQYERISAVARKGKL